MLGHIPLLHIPYQLIPVMLCVNYVTMKGTQIFRVVLEDMREFSALSMANQTTQLGIAFIMQMTLTLLVMEVVLPKVVHQLLKLSILLLFVGLLFAANGQGVDGLLFVEEMRKLGLQPNAETVLAVFMTCASAGAV